MQYQISFQESPPEARIIVEGKDGCVMLSRTVPITENTTKEELHDIGLRLVIEQEEAFAKYDAEVAVEALKVSKLKELESAFSDGVTVKEGEVEAKKAEIVAVEAAKLQAIEDERIAKEEAEAAALKAKEDVVEPPVEKVIAEEPV